jgi:ethanolamine utilization protein EutP
MKKIILIGSIGCGKTTLCQRINGLDMVYKKTQSLKAVKLTIDTPGEYLENRLYNRALVITSTEADVVVFVQDATAERFMFSPSQASSYFPKEVIGVVSKTDAATEKQIKQAEELLHLAGVSQVFRLSSLDGSGVDAFIDYIS